MIIGSRPRPTYTWLGKLVRLAVFAALTVVMGYPLLLIPPFLAKCFFRIAAVS